MSVSATEKARWVLGFSACDIWNSQVIKSTSKNELNVVSPLLLVKEGGKEIPNCKLQRSWTQHLYRYWERNRNAVTQKPNVPVWVVAAHRLSEVCLALKSLNIMHVYMWVCEFKSPENEDKHIQCRYLWSIDYFFSDLVFFFLKEKGTA